MKIRQTMILLGGDGYTATVAETAKAAGIVVLGFLCDSEEFDSALTAIEINRLGTVEELATVVKAHRNSNFHAASSDPETRKQWLDVLSDKLIPPVIHPTAVVSPTATIDDGSYIGPCAVVGPSVNVGRGVSIGAGTIIGPGSILESFATISNGAIIETGMTIAESKVIDAGSIVK